jgi:sterol 3beta-glucosyltransferase
MKIALTTHGTRGDVQPFVAVALALKDRGHDVTLAVPPNLQEWAGRCGVAAGRIAIDSQAFMESEQGRAWLAAGNMATFMKHISAEIRANRDALIADQQRACDGADVIVAGFLTEDHSSVMAESRSVPMVSLHLAPMRPTSAFPNGLVTTRPLPFGALNRATHALFDRLWWGGYRDDVNTFRGRVGLAPTAASTAKRQAARGAFSVQAYSPLLVAQPDDWGETQPVVGAIGFPAAARARLGEGAPDPALVEWLGQGSAPVYFGLGSMPVRDPAAMLKTVGAVASACGVRALVGAGWSRLEAARDLPEHVRIVGAVDHGWLLPRCAAAVHHGGAGTTHAALAAGLPAVVTSVFADQPFWASRVERLGVGVHLPFKHLAPAALEKALRRALDPSVKEAAQRLGARLAAEPDATARVVEIVERVGA